IYSRLHSHFPTNKNPEYERDLWFYLSGQLTGAFVGRLGCAPSRFLRHLVAAFSAAFHYQTHHPSSLALPILVSVISPAGIFAENSIFTMEYKTDKEIQLAKSLRAFVCASIVQWMSNNWEKVVELRSKREEKPADGRQEVELYKMDWLPELITRCSSDVLDKENVSYFVKKALKEELQNTVTKENIQKKITMEKSVDCKTTKQNKIKNKTQTISELADDETNGNFSVESQTSKKDVAENKNESLNSAQNKGDSVIVVPKKEEKSTPFPKNQEQQNTAALKSNTAENAKEQELVQANKSLNECSEDAHKLLQKTGKETNPATSIVQNGDTTTVHSAQNGEAITTNGTDSHGVSDENIELKLKEIKEIDEVIHKFETTRVTVPSPFTAYMNIKYLIDNLVTKQDSKLAQILQGNCDKIWKKSHD
ncbi:Gem-associated protein 5, partial [Homalodisca vitripennis]